MLKFADKIFVSYPGGAAGDMFAASINGLTIQQTKAHTVSNIPFSIKHLEEQISNESLLLPTAVKDIDFKYISTHLVTGLPQTSIYVVLNDSALTTIIYRQMYLQRLILKLNTGTFSNIIQSLCIKQQWHKAATVWLSFAEKLAIDHNNVRLQSPGMRIDFSDVLNDNFVDSLVNQGWKENIDILRSNHSAWLATQHNFSKESTIESMISKLKTMNWSTLQGTVCCDQPN